jgi:hypothetical protein
MAADDGGVLGNLPRTRPGQRSEKRPGGEAAPAPKPKAKPRAKPAPPAAEVPPADVTPPRPDPRSESDRVSDVVRAASKVAGTGIRVAAGLADEVIRRVRRR